VAETKESENAPAPEAPDAPDPNEDDRRATAAAVNRKRTEKEWEENKKRWRSMGVPKALPAKK
jgi:hypothetical protein